MSVQAQQRSQTSLLRQWRRVILRQSYLFALLLLLMAVLVNALLQPNFFRPTVLNGNLQSFLPLILLASGQAVVIIGGGVDLSIGSIVSLVSVVTVHALGTNPGAGQIALAFALGLAVGLLAGALNGFCVASLRFQPVVTTFATSSIFAGLALWIMPSAGGSVPPDVMNLYLASPLGLPLTLWIVVLVLIAWNLLCSTRYGRYLYAVGGNALSAYVSGVPVAVVQLSTYVIAGLMAALSAFTLVLSTGTGDPLIGGPMMLESIVAVVIGGTRLGGGQGGLTGAVFGVVILGLFLNIIAFANVPAWWQTLVNAAIMVLALAGSNLIPLLRRRAI
uniref:Sugar ABC transporter permease n=1 Tax=Thermogemmatispora argillosa TaxID=2045280 RepID=A0A455SUY0_9CHLR|nr:sugar ABC transporter permease [Thermogemmatispora argillosa]